MKDLIKILELFANQHSMLVSFSYGFDDIISTKDINYPLMYVKINQNTLNSALSTYKLTIYLLELSKIDDSNSLDIISNMESIANDIISYFYEDEIYALNEKNILISPIFNFNDDNLDGVKMEVDFENKKNGCIIPGYSLPLKCSSSVEIPERPLLPYYYPIKITAEGGRKPYKINTDLIYLTEDLEYGVGNYTGSQGEIIFINDNDFTLEITQVSSTPTSNYPYFYFTLPTSTIIGEKIIISFKHKHISGDISNLRVSNKTWSPYDAQSITPIDDNDWHEHVLVFESITTIGDKILFRHSNSNIILKEEIKDFQVEYVDRVGILDFNESVEIYRTWGEYTFNVESNDNQVYNTTINIEVPTPNDDFQLLVSSEDTYYGGISTQVLIYKYSTGYINWGDGVIDSFYATSDTYHMFIHNPIDRIIHMQNIDIYSDKIDGIGYVRDVYGSMMRIKKEWVKKIDASKLSIGLYKGDLLDSWDSYKDINGLSPYRLYSYYHTNNYMNISNLQGNYNTYVLQPYSVNNTNNQYTPRIIGDFGTFLKRYRGTDGILTNYSVIYGANLTYLDRLDEPFKPTTYIYCRGYNTNSIYWAIHTPNEVAQIIIDVNKWATVKNGITIYLTNNASPNNADEPYLTQFNDAKNEWINAGGIIHHS